MKPAVDLPARDGSNGKEQLIIVNSLVIIGANGSGKSRLGAWIETNMKSNLVHRISAQRSLVVPEDVPPVTLEKAESALFWGVSPAQPKDMHFKGVKRWNDNKFTTSMLNDYSAMLSTLFARINKRNYDFVDYYKKHVTPDNYKYLPIPESPGEILLRIWTELMPHRQLIIEDGKIVVKIDEMNKYHGKEMSDGERVALYLIGQCLCVPSHSIIIIDEPEIHLHKAIMSRLWDLLEEEKPDCLFIYITHDVDFASSRVGSTKLWVKSTDSNHFTWEIAPDVEEIPQDALLELLGSRKRILFTEGEKGSIDYRIFSILYPDFTLQPRGNCEKVIESTRAWRANPQLHHFESFGIIDRDFRTDEEIEALKRSGIYAIDVAEIENLLCVPEIVTIVAQAHTDDHNTALEIVKRKVLNKLKELMVIQVSDRAYREIYFQLSRFGITNRGVDKLQAAFHSHTASIDIKAIYTATETKLQRIIENDDYIEALKYFNWKSLMEIVASEIGLSSEAYLSFVLKHLRSNAGEHLRQSLMKYLPMLSTPSSGDGSPDEGVALAAIE